MALSKTTVTVHGFEAVDAYHRIESLTHTGKHQINFTLRSYKTTEYPFFKEEWYSCDYDINGENPLKQAYAYLKTLPEYADAIDC